MSDFFGIPKSKLPIAVAMVIVLAAIVTWLQGRFNSSDVKKAIAIALSYRPADKAPSVFDALMQLKEGDPRCDGEVLSQLLGDVRVTCATPGKPEVQYEFRVLLDGKKPPKPASQPAERLFAQLAR